jgi:uncharacterized membrane-anchored protein
MKLRLLAALLLPVLALADPPTPTPDKAAQQAARQAQVARLSASLHYRDDVADLGKGLAKVAVAKGYKYLDPDDSATVVFKIWGNPSHPGILGMIVPENFDPLSADSWAVIITYVDDGYVKDNDADKINYDDLLKQLKEGATEANKQRVSQGYPPIDVVGWAEPPRYDSATHKLYWAKEIKFGNEPVNTLNYNFRVLGKGGVLVLNAVAPITSLGAVKSASQDVLSMVDFEPGHRYADFRQGTDKVATYGIAALVAGGIAAKVGLFKGVWIAILALKKFIIIGFLAIARYAKAIWAKITGRAPSTEPPEPSKSLEPPGGSS